MTSSSSCLSYGSLTSSARPMMTEESYTMPPAPAAVADLTLENLLLRGVTRRLPVASAAGIHLPLERRLFSNLPTRTMTPPRPASPVSTGSSDNNNDDLLRSVVESALNLIEEDDPRLNWTVPSSPSEDGCHTGTTFGVRQ